MDQNEIMSSITGRQIRCARAALGWNIERLANASGISSSTIKRMEMHDGIPPSTTANLMAITTSLEAAGIEFIGSPEDRPGIRIGAPKPPHE
jgi:ribosome-binding protein aMBF1 (putative translation factor)